MKYVGVGSMVCLAAGMGCLAYAFHLWHGHAEFAASALSADGEITGFEHDVDRKHRTSSSAPIVTFTTDKGRVLRISGAAYSSWHLYDRGDHVRVLYPANDPDQARIDTFSENWLGVVLAGGIGTVFFLFGVAPIVLEVRERKTDRWLAQNALRVQAPYAGVEQHHGGGQRWWQIQCRWQHPVSGKEYNFLSEPLRFDPTPFVNRDTIEVLVNADNPKRYRMDISFLPQVA